MGKHNSKRVALHLLNTSILRKDDMAGIHTHNRQRRLGFTLVELLVVIAIIGILVALLLPAVQAAREAARRTQCTNQLKQIGLAVHNYEGSFKRAPGGSSYPNYYANNNYWKNGERVEWNWITAILPFMEQQALMDTFSTTYGATTGVWPGDGAVTDINTNNGKCAAARIPTMLCPSDPFSSITMKAPGELKKFWVENPDTAQGSSYMGSMGPTIQDVCAFDNAADVCMGSNWGTPTGLSHAPCFGGKTCVQQGTGVGFINRVPKGIAFRRVTDGLSQTFLVGETLADDSNRNCIFCANTPLASTQTPMNTQASWRDGDPDAYYVFNGFRSAHPSGGNMAYGDGSVQFIQDDIDYRMWNYLGTTAGGETEGTQALKGTGGGGGRD
jgi:prepilin-type N-terminal cleavage/methylation domain-containing protein/prepilin-type processing-associated H-X9-DG protein